LQDNLSQLTPEIVAKLREKALSSFYFFAKGILGFDWLVPHIHGPVCALLADDSANRVRIVLPRSWLKSTVATIAYPIWMAIRNPDIRICIVQNSHSNAIKKLAVIRGKWETCALLRALFPELLPDKTCTWTTDQLCIMRKTQSAESTFEAAGTRTKLTSRHYDIIIEDDTVAPDLDDMTEGTLLPSKEDVEQAIGWHRLALPLLVDSQKGKIIIVGTRWFEKDLISWNMENEPQYRGYMRAVRETNGLADEGGQLTYPERFNDSVLEELSRSMGPYLYSCLYMNKPLRSGDMIFQPEWFTYYDTPTRDLICYTTVDPAGDPEESKGDPDWNVVVTTGKDIYTGSIFVLDITRKQCNPSELIQAVFDHVRRFKPLKVGLEAVQYQKALIHYVRERQRKEGLYFAVEAITHGKRTKNSRIQGLQPLVKSGMLKFKRSQSQAVSEFLAFPFGANDDVPDAISMQIPMWAITRSAREETRQNPEDDPLTLDHAIKELQAKAKTDLVRTHAWRDIA